jgi:hypothetical protein
MFWLTVVYVVTGSHSIVRPPDGSYIRNATVDGDRVSLTAKRLTNKRRWYLFLFTWTAHAFFFLFLQDCSVARQRTACVYVRWWGRERDLRRREAERTFSYLLKGGVFKKCCRPQQQERKKVCTEHKNESLHVQFWTVLLLFVLSPF